MSSDPVRQYDTGLGQREQFEGGLLSLASSWARCVDCLRDLRAPMLEEQVIQPLLDSGDGVVSELMQFFTYLDSARAEITEMELADLSLSEVEIEKRIDEAQQEWGEMPGQGRTRFGLDFGQFAHGRFEEEILKSETTKGRVRNLHFGLEYELKHPDGRNVRYDYVDFEKHLIVDYKSGRTGQSESQLAKNYKSQRQRHIDAYVAKFGVVPTYQYITYPSTKDMYPPSDG